MLWGAIASEILLKQAIRDLVWVKLSSGMDPKEIALQTGTPSMLDRIRFGLIGL